MKMENSLNLEVLVFLEIILFQQVSHLKLLDTTYLLIAQKNQIQYLLGAISVIKITVNSFPILVTLLTVHLNLFGKSITKRSQIFRLIKIPQKINYSSLSSSKSSTKNLLLQLKPLKLRMHWKKLWNSLVSLTNISRMKKLGKKNN